MMLGHMVVGIGKLQLIPARVVELVAYLMGSRPPRL
jgi:hypothetical protein